MAKSYSVSGYCRYCNKKFRVESNLFPCETIGWLVELKAFIHVLRYHKEEVTLKKILRSLWVIFKEFCVVIPYFILIVIRCIFFPIYWLLEQLY